MNWRRGPESNRPTRICNPVHNRFATAPFLVTKKGSCCFPNLQKDVGSSFNVWSGIRGSNSRPIPWQGIALPTELIPHTSLRNREPIFYIEKPGLSMQKVQCFIASAVVGGATAAAGAASALTSVFTGSSSGRGCGRLCKAISSTWSIHLTGMISRLLFTFSGIS